MTFPSCKVRTSQKHASTPLQLPAMSMSSLSSVSTNFSGATDASRLLRLHTHTDAVVLLPQQLDGIERICPDGLNGADSPLAGFRFTLLALCTDAALQSADWIGQPLLIELLTAQARSALRPFSGYITAFENLGADGGYGYYHLTVEPWLTYLGYRRDSYVFHDMTLVEIVESVFADYLDTGSINPLWRWDLADASVYRQRSTCTQYRETDLAFIERLLAEEGLYYWFEHKGGSTAGEATHTLVIADHLDAFKAGAQETVRFHRADATEQSDTLQALDARRALHSQSLTLGTWNARTRTWQRSSAATATHDSEGNASAASALADYPLERQDPLAPYAWPDSQTGERLARRQQEAIEADHLLQTGQSTVRSFAPGTTFTLQQHYSTGPDGQAPRYTLISIEHHARNNLGATLSERITRLTIPLTQTQAPKRFQLPPVSPNAGAGAGAGAATGAGAGTPASATAATADTETLYTNRITVIPATLPWRAPVLDSRTGQHLRPAPCIRGTLTAIVVGDAGQPVHTDRDNRIKVQFHWQRGNASHNRLTHPGGEDNAPADASAWSWARLMTDWAGCNWGSVFIPRIGQEVTCTFLEGHPDRPIIIGALPNGKGAQTAQNNEIGSGAGSATGNAPAWFAGTATDNTNTSANNTSTSATRQGPGHAHPDTFAGIKTQALGASQSGTGGYNQLVFDLTPREARTQLATTQHASSLNLGRNRHQTDNRRLDYRGHGAELTTTESGALRAGSGLLLTSVAQQNANGAQLDAKVAQSQLDKTHTLVTTLADSAKKQKAHLEGDTDTDKLPAIEHLAHSQEVLATTDTHGSAEDSTIGGGTGTVPAWSDPMLVAESPAGINLLTPQNLILNTGTTFTVAGADIHLAAQGKSVWAVANGIALYTYGKQADPNRPVADLGLKLHAAQGTLSVQAQTDKADFNADKKVTLASTTEDILLQGKNDLLLTAAGAAIQLSGGNITLLCPGKVELKASKKNWTGPKSTTNAETLKSSQLEKCEWKS